MLKLGLGLGRAGLASTAALASTATASQQRRSLADLTRREDGEVTAVYENGLPVVRVPLPSRRERGVFTLKPVSQTVAEFLQQIKDEDAGVSHAAVYDAKSERIAGATLVEDLVRRGEFRLRLNDDVFEAEFPPVFSDPVLRERQVDLTTEALVSIDEMRTLVGKMHSVLNVSEHQQRTEKELLERIEEIKGQLQPYEDHQERIRALGERMAEVGKWGLLGMMGIQWGMFARLTWWEYSWDIMEPVTYFATYSTVIVGYCYWIMTKSPVEYGEMMDRIALKTIHRNAKRLKFDMDKYNALKDALANEQYELHRLRDPHRLKLPPRHLRQAIAHDDQKRHAHDRDSD